MYHYILLLHVLASTIWTGGHLVLAMTILPRVLEEKSPSDLLRFESGYEKIGIPALIIQVVTGLWLAHNLMPDIGMWFSFENSMPRLIFVKLTLLLLTALFAIDAKLRIIPKLTEQNLMSLAYHIIPFTIISVLFVVKQRGKMSRGSGKTASKTVHPDMCHDPVFCRRNLGCYLWILLPKLEGVIL